ncbi:TPA: adhesive domain-containing protein [Listeria monocytogenes]
MKQLYKNRLIITVLTVLIVFPIFSSTWSSLSVSSETIDSSTTELGETSDDSVSVSSEILDSSITESGETSEDSVSSDNNADGNESQTLSSSQESEGVSDIEGEELLKSQSETQVKFDGEDLRGTDKVEYDVRDAQVVSRTIDIEAKFDSSNEVTNRKINIEVNNGLSLVGAPGIVSRNGEKVFDSSTLPVSLKGIITNAEFIPNDYVYGYKPNSGILSYDVSSGTESVSMELQTSLDMPFSANDGEKEFLNVLKITTSEINLGQTKINYEETLESYKIKGSVYPMFYAAEGANSNVTKNVVPGASVETDYILKSNGNGQPYSFLGSVLYDEYSLKFEFDKELGFSKVDSPDDSLTSTQFSYSVDKDTNPSKDLVTINIKELSIGNPREQRIRFYFKLADNIDEGNYDVEPLESMAKPYGYKELVNLGTYNTYRIHVENKEFENKLSLREYNSTLFKSTEYENAKNLPLGAYFIGNEQINTVTNQKINLSFDDSSIGVTGVQLVVGYKESAKNIEIITNKSNYVIENLPSNVDYEELTSSAFFELSQITTDQNEYIKNISYESTNFLTGSGYGPAQRSNYENWSQIPGVFYGELKGKGNTNSYTSKLSVASSNGEENADYDSVNLNMNVENNGPVAFDAKSSFRSEYFAGDTMEMNATINLVTSGIKAAFLNKGYNLYLRQGDYFEIDLNSIELTQDGEVIDGIFPYETIDNRGGKVFKLSLDKLLLGIKKDYRENYKLTVKYKIKIKNSTPTIGIRTSDLLAIIPQNNIKVLDGLDAGNYSASNNVNEFDVDGSGDIEKIIGTLRDDQSINIRSNKNFQITSSANLNDGPWQEYDYENNSGIIDLNPAGKAKYRLEVSNNTGDDITGYSALVPIPKAGEATKLIPDSPDEFNPAIHIQKEAFQWTTSLSKELNLLGKLDYTVLYATKYETDKDSTNFKQWDDIQDKNSIRMIKISTSSKIPDGFTESIDFPIELNDPEADINVGKVNIYSARIFREISGSAGYVPSEPIAIRLKTGVLKGIVFNDENKDGIKNGKEKGRQGVSVLAKESGTENIVGSTVTKVDGSYEFLGLDKKQKVDIFFKNPTSDDSTRFSPSNESTVIIVPDSDQKYALAANLTPSDESYYKEIDVGIMTPTVVTFDVNGGDIETTKIKAYPGEFIEKEPIPNKYGYNFLGWYTDNVGGDKVNFPYTIGKTNLTLYAKYNFIVKESYTENGTNKVLKDPIESPFFEGNQYPAKPTKYIMNDDILYIYIGYKENEGELIEAEPRPVGSNVNLQYIYEKADKYINVTIPTEIVFGTFDNTEEVKSNKYEVENNSQELTTSVSLEYFQEVNSSVQLLGETEGPDEKIDSARLNLLINDEPKIKGLNDLKSNIPLVDLEPKSSATMGISGEYFAKTSNINIVEYKTALKFKAISGK